MYHFFISYSHQSAVDQSLAQFLADGLRHVGNEVFIDTDLSIGEKWDDAIEKALSESDFLIVLLSEASIKSDMVRGEVRRARELASAGKRPRIMPVRVAYHDYLGYELDSYLAGIQYLLWTSPSDSPNILAEISNIAGSSEVERTDRLSLQNRRPKRSQRRDIVRGPEPTADPRPVRTAGGTLSVDNPFFVERLCDTRLLERVDNSGETIIIQGAR